jgi:enterochelin esterase-like enzyme
MAMKPGSSRSLARWGRVSGLVVVLLARTAQSASSEVRTVTIDSPSNGRQTNFAIYVPPGYEEKQAVRYPVVYCLHGLSGSPTRRTGQMVPALDAAMIAGRIVPMIWVFPDGQANSFYGDAFDRHKQVYSNIITEVVPYVDRHFRTRNSRAFRAIEGFSMGGYGAAMLGAKHPELFSAIVEYAGAFAGWAAFQPDSRREMYNDQESNFLPYSAWEMSRRNARELRERTDYLMVVGDEDQEFQNNIRFRDYLKTLDVTPEFVVLHGFGHNGRAYADEGTGMRFLSKHFERAAAP